MQDPIAHYQHLLAATPQDPELRLAFAHALGEAQRPDEAARAYMEAARLLARQRAGRRAIQACLDALRLLPNDPEVLALVERLCATSLEAGRAWREARGLASHVPAQVMPRRTQATPGTPAGPYAQQRPAPPRPAPIHKNEPDPHPAPAGPAPWQEIPTTRIPALKRPAPTPEPPPATPVVSIPAPSPTQRSRRPAEAARAEIDQERAGTARSATTPAAWQTSTVGRGGSALDRLRAATSAAAATVSPSSARQTLEADALTRNGAPLPAELSRARLPTRAPIIQPAGLALTPGDLPEAPLWSGLDDTTRRAMLGNTALLSPQPDATLVDAEHDPTRIFVLLRGECLLAVRQHTQDTPAARLRPGALLGASELLGRVFPGRRITAQGEVELLELGARTLTVLGRQDPAIWNHIWEAHYDALLRSTLAVHPIFQTLPLHALDDAAGRFKRAWARAGDALLPSATTHGGLLLVLNGALEIARAQGVRSLLAGELFDAGITARSAARLDRITATENTTAALLPRLALTDLARTYPGIIDGFKRWSL